MLRRGGAEAPARLMRERIAKYSLPCSKTHGTHDVRLQSAQRALKDESQLFMRLDLGICSIYAGLRRLRAEAPALIRLRRPKDWFPAQIWPQVYEL